jgi:hypothetical protein
VVKHDLFGKPVSTHRVKARGHAFPDHALAERNRNHMHRAKAAEASLRLLHLRDRVTISGAEAALRRSNIVLVNCATFAEWQDETTIVAWRANAAA